MAGGRSSWKVGVGAVVLVAVAVALGTLGGGADDGGDGGPRTSTPVAVATPTLPPGSLSALVLQPGEVPTGLVAVLEQSGTADVTKLASFSADPAAASAALRSHGFTEGYLAQYADPKTRRVLVSVATRFATVAGAEADLTGDLKAQGSSGTPVAVPGLGDQAGGVMTPLDAKAKTGELVTLRFRKGSTTWLLAVGSPEGVEVSDVRALAELLLARG